MQPGTLCLAPWFDILRFFEIHSWGIQSCFVVPFTCQRGVRPMILKCYGWQMGIRHGMFYKSESKTSDGSSDLSTFDSYTFHLAQNTNCESMMSCSGDFKMFRRGHHVLNNLWSFGIQTKSISVQAEVKPVFQICDQVSLSTDRSQSGNALDWLVMAVHDFSAMCEGLFETARRSIGLMQSTWCSYRIETS